MENKKAQPLQEPFLNLMRRDKVQVSIYLQNGIKLEGRIESFDQHVILLIRYNTTQMVYKHAIATVVPDRPITLKDLVQEDKPAS